MDYSATCGHSHDGIRRDAKELERAAHAAFLELLANVGAYDAETLRRVASHLREREKWEDIMAARAKARKPLPWEKDPAPGA